jgi:hypothetical protein
LALLNDYQACKLIGFGAFSCRALTRANFPPGALTLPNGNRVALLLSGSFDGKLSRSGRASPLVPELGHLIFQFRRAYFCEAPNPDRAKDQWFDH